MKTIIYLLIFTCATLCFSQEENNLPITEDQAIIFSLEKVSESIPFPELQGIPSWNGEHWTIPVGNRESNLDCIVKTETDILFTNASDSTENSVLTEDTNDHYLITSVADVKLDIAFISQVPPGEWNYTKNCGQTSALLGAAFLKSMSPYSGAITQENAWLAKTYNDSRYLNSNGWYTDTAQLSRMIREYWGISSVNLRNMNIEFLRQELLKGKPVIVAVRLNMDPQAAGHFMLLTGMAGSYVYFNDPGKTFGKGRKFSIDTFKVCWKTQGYSCVTFSNSSTDE